MANVQQKKIDKWQPDWVALRILDFARKVHEFGNDDKALAEWTRQMSEDLIFNNTSSEDEFTQNLLAEASDAYAKKSKAGRKGGIAKARNRKNSGSAMPADKREQGEDNTADIVSGDGPEPDNLSGNALDGDTSDGDSPLSTEEGLADRTNVSGPFEARQSQNATEDAAIREDAVNNHDAPSGQTRCGTLESGTSSVANFHDQATITDTSTDEARQSQTGAGAPSVREKCCHDAPAPQGSRRVKPKRPKNAAEVVAWAADHGIDEVDARDWYELNFVIRPGCDKDGCVIENWPGHCISYCRAVKEKRESA